MGIYGKSNGEWTPIYAGNIKRSGVWENLKYGYVKVSGEWKAFFSGITPSIRVSGLEVSRSFIGDQLEGYRGTTLTDSTYNYQWLYWGVNAGGSEISPNYGPSGTLNTTTLSTTLNTSLSFDKRYYKLEIRNNNTLRYYYSNVVYLHKYKPVVLTQPTLTGLAQVGQTLTISGDVWKTQTNIASDTTPDYYVATWTGNSGTTTYSSRSTDPNYSSTWNQYVVKSGDLNGSISVYITAYNSYVNSSMVVEGTSTNTLTSSVITGIPTLITNPTFTGTGQSGTNFSITGGSWNNATSITRYIEATASNFVSSSSASGYDALFVAQPTVLKKYRSSVDGSYTVLNTDAQAPAYYFRGVVVATGPGGSAIWTSGASDTYTGGIKSYITPTVTTPTNSAVTTNGFTVSWTPGPSGYVASSTVQIWNSAQTSIVATITNATSPYVWTGGSANTTYYSRVIVYANDGNVNTGAGQTSTTSAFSAAITTSPIQYTVTWNANGGTVSPTSSTVNAGSSVTAPTPTRTNYTFNGWYTAASGGSFVVGAGGSYTPSSSITLYAQWTIIQYTVTWDANGGTVSPTSSTVNAGSSVTAPFATRSGFNFLGWYNASTGGSFIVDGGISYTPTSSITLYARWSAIVPVLSSWRVVDRIGDTGIYLDSISTTNTGSISYTIYGRNSTGSAWSTAQSGTTNNWTTAGSYIGQSLAAPQYLYYYVQLTPYYGTGGTGTAGTTRTGQSWTVSKTNTSVSVLGTESF